MQCPKCNSGNVESYHEEASTWTIGGPGKPTRVFHCLSCGTWKFGAVADQIVSGDNKTHVMQVPTPTRRKFSQPTLLPPQVPIGDFRRVQAVKTAAEALRTEAQGLKPVDTEIAQLVRQVDESLRTHSTKERKAQIQRAETALSKVQAEVQALPPKPEPQNKCAWEQCSNPANAGSKYCSVACRNRLARQQYKIRNRASAKSVVLSGPDAAMAALIRQFRSVVGIPVKDR